MQGWREMSKSSHANFRPSDPVFDGRVLMQCAKKAYCLPIGSP